MSEYKPGDYVWIGSFHNGIQIMRIIGGKDKLGWYHAEFRYKDINHPTQRYKGRLEPSAIRSKATRLEEVLFGWD